VAERPCPSCRQQSYKAAYFFRDADGRFLKALRLIECSACGLVYVSPLVREKTLYFPHYYGRRRGLPSLIFEPFNRLWVRWKVRRLITLMPGRKLLDFGGGRGDFAKAMREKDCEVWILEPQSDALSELRLSLGDHAVGSLDALRNDAGLFDAVTLWHVLEHLEDPVAVLSDLHRRVQPGGLLFLAVPNWASMERRVFGDRWFHLDVPRHQLHFTFESLRHLLDRTGWEVRSISYASWSYNGFGLFQSILNIGPGPRNLFYRVCKRGMSFNSGEPYFWAGLLWTICMTFPAMIITLSLIGFLTLTHRTGTLEVVAVKKG